MERINLNFIQDDGDKNDGDYSPKKGTPSKKKAPAAKRGRKKKDDSDSDEDWKGAKKGAKKTGVCMTINF